MLHTNEHWDKSQPRILQQILSFQKAISILPIQFGGRWWRCLDVPLVGKRAGFGRVWAQH